jgi:molybdenum cofactor cytidylyltransferase
VARAIVGLLLAAGRGARFDPSGRLSKLLAAAPGGPHAGAPLAVAAARNLRAVLPEVIAVVRPLDPAADGDNARLHAALRAEGCALVVNPRADDGMGTSIAAGVQAANEADGYVIALADMPAIAPDTIAAVVQALRAGALTVAPQVGAQRGHPVGFAAALREELAALAGDEGARSVLRRHPPRLIDVDDPGALLDIDTPDALERERSAGGQ